MIQLRPFAPSREVGGRRPRTYPQFLCISLKKAAPAQAQALGKQGVFHWLLLFWAQILAPPFPQGAACPGSDAR